MARRARLVAGVAACAGALAACNLIAGLGEDFRVDPDGSTTTGSEGGTDGPSDPDGSLDGSRTDAPNDGGFFDGKTEKFCATADSGTNGNGFCWDFENAGPGPAFGWNEPRFESAASLTDASVLVLSGSGIDGTHGLDVSIAQTAKFSNVWLSKTLDFVDPTGLVRIEVEFDFNVVSATSIYSGGVGMLTFPGPSTEIGVSTYDTATTVSKLVNAGPLLGIVQGTWNHVLIVLQRPNLSVMFSQTVTVTNANDAGKVVDTDSGVVATGQTEIRLGVFSTAPTAGTMRARFDHLVVRRQ